MRYLVLLILFGCATQSPNYNGRISDHQLDNGMPNYRLSDFHFNRAVKRSPASVQKNWRPKKLYFLTLMSQYQQFKTWDSSLADVKICPQFHNDILEYKALIKHEVVKNRASINLQGFKREKAELYPELYLTTSNGRELGERLPATNKELLDAVKVHAGKIHTELISLCDTGISDNLYVFQNLITHMNQYKNFHYSRKGLATLLKTPVFSNIQLLYLMRAEAVSAQNINYFERQLMDQIGVGWFAQYPRYLAQKRRESGYLSQK